MTTEQVLFEARMAVARANSNSIMNLIIILLLIGGLIMWFEYVLRRWSWMPRKQQRVRFGERF